MRHVLAYIPYACLPGLVLLSWRQARTYTQHIRELLQMIHRQAGD